MNNPLLAPIPQLMSMSIAHVHELDGRNEEIVFNLPPDTPPRVYDRVSELLGSGRPMQEVGETAIHVIEVRVRAVQSEVDLVHLNADGEPQEMTIGYRQNLLKGFRIEFVRPWRYRVVMPPADYLRDPLETVPVEEPAEQAVGATDSHSDSDQ
jgi:hypothetical protein